VGRGFRGGGGRSGHQPGDERGGDERVQKRASAASESLQADGRCPRIRRSRTPVSGVAFLAVGAEQIRPPFAPGGFPRDEV
jgi:hypothetical protein